MGCGWVRASTTLDSGGFQKPHLETSHDREFEIQIALQGGVVVRIVEPRTVRSRNGNGRTNFARGGLETRYVRAWYRRSPLIMDSQKHQHASPTSSAGGRRNLPRGRLLALVVRRHSSRRLDSHT